MREQLIRAVNAGRQLAPEAEADIHPPAFAVLRFDERAFLHTRVEFEPIGDLEQVLVPRVVVGVEEIQTALLDPAVPRLVVDSVRRVHQRIVFERDLDRRMLVGHAIVADLRRIRTVLRVVELELVVLHDHRSAVVHVVEQPRVVRAQVGAPLVGAHAGDDGVEA